MAKRKVVVLYDPKIDFLEVFFEKKAGYYDPVDGNEDVMIKYDMDGKVIGFSIDGLNSSSKERIDLEIELNDLEPEQAVSASGDE